MRKVLLLSTALAALVMTGAARADQIDDPLHGSVCSSTAPGTGCVNTDNGNFAPDASNNFGFVISPGPASGNLTLVIGVPTNEIDVTTYTLNGLVDNSSTSIATNVFSRTSLFNSSSPVLSSFLGLGSFSPTDNYSNLSAGTAANDTGFTGNYLLLTATISGITLDANGATSLTNDFSGINLPDGSFITGLFVETNPNSNNVGTAASGHLVVTNAVSVPSPVVGAGFPGIITALLGLWALARRRRANAFVA